MVEGSRQFQHIPLGSPKRGSAYSRRYPVDKSPRSKENLQNRSGHGNGLKSSLASLVSEWESSLESRQQQRLPDLPKALPLLLQVDPQTFDADSLKSFDIEVILELEDGYILGASADAEFPKIKNKIEKFIAEEKKSGKVAEIWEISARKLEDILSLDLLEKWDTIQDEQIYTVDVSIGGLGLNWKLPERPKKNPEEDSEKYKSKVAQWREKQDRIEQKWQELLYEKELEFQNFVSEVGGNLHSGAIYDDTEGAAFLPDSFSCRIKIPGKGLKDLAINYPYLIEIVEPEPISQPISVRDESGTTKIEFTLKSPSTTAPKVCIIDSGLQEDHRLLSAAIDKDTSLSWVPGAAHLKSDYVREGGHGTRVAGAVLYPRGVPRAGQEIAICWLQNARVLGNDNEISERLYLPKVLNKIVDFYNGMTGTRIFNHSINSSAPCRKIYMSAWAAGIDYLSWENDILFIVSSGNLPRVRLPGLSITRKAITEHFQKGCVYPDFLLKDSSRIADPAQSFQALTVGSIAHCTYNYPPKTSIADQDRPSAFSCTGYGIWGSIKPEVVEYGGDLVMDEGDPPNLSTVPHVCSELVRNTRSGGPALAKDNVGTSFAAPKVTHIAAALAARFPEKSCLLYKALIVQSARLPTWATSAKDLSPAIRMMGYGLPNLERALGSSSNRITLITDEEVWIHPKQADVYQVRVPDQLQSPAQEFDVLVEVTLSYKAEPRRTRRNKRKYLSTWLDWSCSRKGESQDQFLSRSLKQNETSAEPKLDRFDWVLGEQKNYGSRVKNASRGVGTIQKDWTRVKSFDLRESFCIAVVAHQGWSNLSAQVPYTLVVSFESMNAEIPIYSLFAQAQVSLKMQQQVKV